MRIKMKRFLGILLSFALVLGLMPGMGLTAYADPPSVTFLNANGETETCYLYNEVTNSNKTLNPGWNVVKESVTISDSPKVEGELNIILCDGATLTIASGSSYAVSSSGDFTIYAQSTGNNMGELVVSSTGNNALQALTDLTINGGKISVNSNSASGIVNLGSLTINGGNVTVSGSTSAISGQVANSIPGIGWTNTDGTDGKTDIEISNVARSINSYKRVMFQAGELYPLWVGGTQVTSGNASNIDGNNTASYESVTNTLTLNNYIYDGVGYTNSNQTADGILYSGTEDLKVHLTGQNQVKLSTEDSIINGYGIRVDGSADLVITGEGSLTVSSTNANHPTGLKVNSLTIDEGTSVSVTAGNASSGQSKGIYANDTIKVNGVLEAMAGDALGNNRSSSGIDFIGNDNKIIIGTKGKITAKSGKCSSNSYGIRTSGPIEVNGTLDAEGGEASNGRSYGVRCEESFLSNGKVTAKGGKSSSESYGIEVSDGTLTVKSGTFTVEGGASEFSFGIMATKTISLIDGVVNASEKSVSETGVGIASYESIDIGEKTVLISTGKYNAIMAMVGTISSQIDGKGWDNTQGTGNGSPIKKGDNLDVSNYKKVQFPDTKPAATVIEAPTAISDLIYTGSAQELVNAGTVSGGTMHYALGTKDDATDEYTASIPTATKAGTYYVWYKAIGDESHSNSGENFVTVKIGEKTEAHKHDIKHVEAKDPTCTEDGYEAHYECTICHELYADDTGSVPLDKNEITKKATGHKWDDGVITQEATYDETGIKTYTCSVCGETKAETIPVKIRRYSSSSDSSDSDSESSGGGSSGKSGSISTKSIDVNGNTVQTQPDSGAPLSDSGGNWGNQDHIWTYTKSDGSLARGEWLNLEYDGHTYWYYFDDSTIMQTNWFDYNGSRYFLVPEMDGWRGRMATGWHMVDNKWYYFEPTIGANQGILYRGMTTPDGHTVGADGAWDGNGTTPVGAIHTGTTVTMN